MAHNSEGTDFRDYERPADVSESSDPLLPRSLSHLAAKPTNGIGKSFSDLSPLQGKHIGDEPWDNHIKGYVVILTL